MSALRVRVLYFAGARELSGVGAEEVALDDGATVDDLIENILRRHSALEVLLRRSDDGLRVAAVSVNGEYAEDGSIRLTHGAEVAILPPVSGG
jgi:MoaD family protein